MKILTLYYTHKPGGFCRRLYRLQQALVDGGHDVFYACLDLPPGELFPKGAKWVRIPFPLTQRCGVLFWLLLTLWLPIFVFFFCWRNKIERLVPWNGYYGAMVALASVLLRIPSSLFFRSLVLKNNQLNGKSSLLIWPQRALDWLALQSATKVVAMTGAMREELQRIAALPTERFSLLPNDLPLVQEVPPVTKNLPLNLLAIGLADQRKNFSVLIAALKHLVKPEKVALTIVGGGPLVPELQKSASAAVSFLPYQRELGDLFAKAHIVIHPSLSEGVSNALLEGLAHRRLVLASDIPEHREILPDSHWLFNPLDAEGLARLIEKYTNNMDLIGREIEEQADKTKKLRFDWNGQIAKIVCGYG